MKHLAENGHLPPQYRDHPLTGNWAGHRDCHIAPDWLLLYKIDKENLVLERTGTHSDLFG
jgi:mRNA interferase YafQ